MREKINSKLKEVKLQPFIDVQLVNLMYFIKYFARSVLKIYALILALIWINVNEFVVIEGVSPKDFIDFVITLNIVICSVLMLITVVSFWLSFMWKQCISRENTVKLFKSIFYYFLVSTILSGKEEMITTTVDFNDIPVSVYFAIALYVLSYTLSRFNIKYFWNRIVKNIEIKSNDFSTNSVLLDRKYLEEQVTLHNHIDEIVNLVALKKEVTKINEGIVDDRALYEVNSVTLALKYSFIPYIDVDFKHVILLPTKEVKCEII
ncbi:hypothetical protein P0E66_11475 [Enterococcus faecalis]|uniref:hypothetical protein n=1 Tax=Enterococcus faecalis TaxID=1351 RepID=UPI0025AF59C2|nr:hypothetical protein [Enterococcus faecalis]MDN3201747.1 hypothetical protein [Enterococcus faecalis]